MITKLEWALQAAIDHWAFGEKMHRRVGMGKSGANPRHGARWVANTKAASAEATRLSAESSGDEAKKAEAERMAAERTRLSGSTPSPSRTSAPTSRSSSDMPA